MLTHTNASNTSVIIITNAVVKSVKLILNENQIVMGIKPWRIVEKADR